MAQYDQLPVYKQSYDLLLELYTISKNMERDFKFTLGEKIKNEVTDLIVNVYRANSRVDKAILIAKARENIEVVRLLMRLYKDLKQIKTNEYVSVSEKIESVSKQLAAWHNSQQKQKTIHLQGQSLQGLFALDERTD
jgi:aminoglycoside phosphotransferase family enzyme